MIHYRHVAAAEVDANVVKAADGALRRATADLCLGQVEIVWFRETNGKADFAEPGRICGQARGLERGRVWVNADLSVAEADRTVAHELRHVFQFENGMAPIVGGAGPLAEVDARLYELGAHRHLDEIVHLAGKLHKELRDFEEG